MLEEMSECVTRVPLLGSSDPRHKCGQTPTITEPFLSNERLEVVKEHRQKKWLPHGDPGQLCHFSLDTETVFRDVQ